MKWRPRTSLQERWPRAAHERPTRCFRPARSIAEGLDDLTNFGKPTEFGVDNYFDHGGTASDVWSSFEVPYRYSKFTHAPGFGRLGYKRPAEGLVQYVPIRERTEYWDSSGPLTQRRRQASILGTSGTMRRTCPDFNGWISYAPLTIAASPPAKPWKSHGSSASADTVSMSTSTNTDVPPLVPSRCRPPPP